MHGLFSSSRLHSNSSFKVPRRLKAFQRMLGLMASASSVIQLGLLHMRPLQYWLKPRVPPDAWHHGHLLVKVIQACDAALAAWKNYQWMEWGVPLAMVYRKKAVSKDDSNLDGHIHINCLEMLAVYLGLRTFLSDLRGHHVLVRSDSMMVVSYINRQGCLSSRRRFILAECLLRWAQLNLRSLRATHVPGKLNLGADMLFRSNVPKYEWLLHPQTVQEIWGIFGRP